MNALEAYGIKFAGEINLSDNGVYFTVKKIENMEYKSNIYHFNTNLKEITHSGYERSPVYFDHKLYFIRSEKNMETLMCMPDNEDPYNIFTAYKIKKYHVDEKNFLVISMENGDNEKPFITNKLKYRFNGEGYLRSRYSLYSIKEKQVKKIYNGNFDVTDVKCNNSEIFITTTEENDDIGIGYSNIYSINENGKKIKKINEKPLTISDFAISENGDVAYAGHPTPDTSEVYRIYLNKGVVSIGNDSAPSIISDSFMSNNNKLKFDKNILYAIGQTGSDTHIYSISGDIKRLTGNNMVVKDFDVLNGDICYIYSTPEKPCIINYKGKDYDINPSITGKTPEREKFGNGEGFVMFRSSNSPTLLFIHGGPHDSYGNNYFIEFQYFYENGYNIVYTNPPGSTGYGQEYAKKCVGSWGSLDFNFDLDFLKKFIKDHDVKSSSGVTGGSYGGFMTNWIVTHTDFFKCAVSERSISNIMSMVGTSDIGFWFNTLELDIKDPYSEEGQKKLMDYSPIKYIKNAKTPTMLITGEEDYRCPIEQAEQFFTGLKLNNVDTMLVRYRKDNHEHARAGIPSNMIDRLERKLQWFDKYLKK